MELSVATNPPEDNPVPMPVLMPVPVLMPSLCGLPKNRQNLSSVMKPRFAPALLKTAAVCTCVGSGRLANLNALEMPSANFGSVSTGCLVDLPLRLAPKA